MFSHFSDAYLFHYTLYKFHFIFSRIRENIFDNSSLDISNI